MYRSVWQFLSILTALLNVTVVDECALGTHECDGDADCMDTLDGYSCRCKPGWVDASPDTLNAPGRVCKKGRFIGQNRLSLFTAYLYYSYLSAVIITISFDQFQQFLNWWEFITVLFFHFFLNIFCFCCFFFFFLL